MTLKHDVCELVSERSHSVCTYSKTAAIFDIFVLVLSATVFFKVLLH